MTKDPAVVIISTYPVPDADWLAARTAGRFAGPTNLYAGGRLDFLQSQGVLFLSAYPTRERIEGEELDLVERCSRERLLGLKQEVGRVYIIFGPRAEAVLGSSWIDLDMHLVLQFPGHGPADPIIVNSKLRKANKFLAHRNRQPIIWGIDREKILSDSD